MNDRSFNGYNNSRPLPMEPEYETLVCKPQVYIYYACHSNIWQVYTQNVCIVEYNSVVHVYSSYSACMWAVTILLNV